MKAIYKTLLLVASLFVFEACQQDKLSDTSIFDNMKRPKPTAFDQWLDKYYVTPYNIAVKYRFEDIESNLNYNVVPADEDKSRALAKLVKYLWLDVYKKVAPSDFLPLYAPKVLFFVGSSQYERNSRVLGTAEGGLKIVMFDLNSIDLDNPDIDVLNENYFHTMHHEFAHILHQTKNYDTSFGLITAGNYAGQTWQDFSNAAANARGFVTSYAMSDVNEDFVETLACYVVYSDAALMNIIKNAGQTGAMQIIKKIEMVKTYFKTKWNIDLDELRKEVQSRQANVQNMDLKTLDE